YSIPKRGKAYASNYHVEERKGKCRFYVDRRQYGKNEGPYEKKEKEKKKKRRKATGKWSLYEYRHCE
ncbi:MAG: hypothetical protein Q9217_004645, partial [Psora testacea]